MPSVAAVVVTFNRADKLARVLDCVLAQTAPCAQVVVVDNASTDHTGEVLARYEGEPTVKVVRLAENTGGAGGFAEGMAHAYADGADFLWIMDDDCYAEPDALEKLLDGVATAESVLNRPVAFAGSLVQFRDGSSCIMNTPRASDDWPELIIRNHPITLVDFCSFVSCLVPAWAVQQAGLPLREYFIWFDDAEYTARLHELGAGIIVHDSLVKHDLAENKGVNFEHVDTSSLWKFKYGARNQSSYQWHHANKFSWLEFVLLTNVRMHRGKVALRHRWAVEKEIAAGLRFDPQVEAAPARTAPVLPPSTTA